MQTGRVCGSRMFWRIERSFFVCLVLLGMLSSASAVSRPPRVRVSCWYWLNSVAPEQWPADFQAMREIGFTDVVLVWGLDGTAFATRIHDSHAAIRAAHKADLGSFLFVWHARHTALPHDPRFQQVDAAGQTLFAFDAFNPEWRNTQWKAYLETVAREYGPEPGMAGYLFDNSFAIGQVGTIDGPPPRPADRYLAYGAAERKLFGKALPTSPEDPAWAEWTRVRQLWWADWASSTQAAIRAVDPDTRHRIVLEDGDNTIDPETESRVGLKLSTVISSFDRMGAYWAPTYSDPAAADKLVLNETAYLTRMRAAIGERKELSLTLRLSDAATEETPGHATKPTLPQIRQLVDAALAMGVRDIDLYGFRMGVYHLDGPGWLRFQPGSGPTYPLTGQVEGKFLADRPELWPGLKAYLAQIEAAPAR